MRELRRKVLLPVFRLAELTTEDDPRALKRVIKEGKGHPAEIPLPLCLGYVCRAGIQLQLVSCCARPKCSALASRQSLYPCRRPIRCACSTLWTRTGDGEVFKLKAGPGTRIDTKNNKNGVLQVPRQIYELLHTYALSERVKSKRRFSNVSR